MNNDLIAMTFDTEEGASKTRQALELMRGSQFWGLVKTVIVSRDSSGTVLVHQQQIPADEYSPSLLLPEVLADEILGASPEAGLRKLVGAGLSETFLKEITSALIPNSSAILIYIQQGSLVNPQQVLDVLRQFTGTVHHTTVPADVETAILGQAGSH
jgi:uncharacterized membrane protein